MNLGDLKAFVAVAEAGSVNRAAAKLNLTQPAVSRRVQSLEAAIGVALLAGVGVRLALVASIAWSMSIWFLGEAMGMLPSGFAMAIFGARQPE